MPIYVCMYKIVWTQHICTYINGHYSPSVRITAEFPTPLIFCAFIFYVSGGTYSLTSTPNNRIFEKLFHGRFICSLSFCQKSVKRKCACKLLYTLYRNSSLSVQMFFFCKFICLFIVINSLITSIPIDSNPNFFIQFSLICPYNRTFYSSPIKHIF